MSDLSDVETKLAEIIGAAIYPNGTAQPSAVGAGCRVYPGWPTSQTLDADLGAGKVNVSIYPVRGTIPTIAQHMGPPQVKTPPVYGLSAEVVANAVTVSGAPTTDEYLSIICGNAVYSRGGAAVEAILTALLADVLVDFPGSTLVGSTLTIAGGADIEVRSGAPAVMVNQIRRILQPMQIAIWAPSHALRTAVGSLINNTLINATRVEMADTSHMRCQYSRTDEHDSRENALLYRRDLIFHIDYAVTEEFTAYKVTSLTTQWQPKDPVGDTAGPPITKVK